MTATAFTLRPLSMGEILDQSIRLYRHNFTRFVGIIALVQVPVSLVTLILTIASTGLAADPMSYSDPIIDNPFANMGWMAAYWAVIGMIMLVGLAGFVLVQGIGTAALARAIADSRLGIGTNIGSAYRSVKTRFRPILLALLVSAGIYILLMVYAILVPCLGWISGPVLLAFFYGIIWPLVVPIIVLENKPAGEAFRRSWDLARRRFWWIIGFVLLLTLLTYLIILGPSAAASYAVLFAAGERMGMIQAQQVSTIVQTVISMLGSVLIIPLQLTAMVLVYFDLRVRTEGLDLAAQSAYENGGALFSDLLAHAPAARNDTLITPKDLGNFTALVVIFGLVLMIGFGTLIGIFSLLSPY